MSRAASDARWFREVLGQYPTGVCVITAKTPEGERAGLAVGSFTSVSLDPPLVAFFPDKTSTSWPKIQGAGRFCVNVLGDGQQAICRRFASKGRDKFDGLDCRETVTGSPIIEDAVAWIDCELHSVQEAGDHYVVLGRVRELDVGSSALPLIFFRGGYGRFAPTDVDVVRSEMERLADELSAQCIATARADGDHLVITASAGSPTTLVGQRLPLGPPTGLPHIAWQDDDAIERWLSDIDERVRERHRERILAVRDRGFSVGLATDAQRTFATMLDRLAAEPRSVTIDELRALIRTLAYDPVELSPEVKRSIRVISAPVFRNHGEVALVLTAYGFPNPRAGGGIEAIVARVRRAAQRASEQLV
jgi:flavin reductase (DIM6/NTAB) family NADH-FMN oxidoreductase RutF/DNA-binding IclR family transcriptional regulator